MKGRKALISGGASGIGKATAAKHIQEEAVAAVAAINLTGEVPLALQASNTCHLGAFDILICNAGRGIHKKMMKVDQAQLARWVTETNPMGKLRLVRAFGPTAQPF